MDNRIKEQFTPEVKAEILNRFDLADSEVEMLDGFESLIFEVNKAGEPCILRISHSLHRSPELIQGEAEWIDYLATHGVQVGQPIRDAHGNLVETLDAEDGTFSAVLFKKVPGTHASKEDWQGDTLMTALGQLVGKMHALAKDFEPSNPDYERLTWDEDIAESLQKFQQHLPPADAPLINRFQQIVRHVQALPRGLDEYGLIHFDVHGGNFFLDNGKVWLFDFDDCCYNWYANDIAMVMFYAAPFECDSPEQIELMKQRFQAFMRGYQQENEIDRDCLAEIPNFMTLREIDLYAAIKRDIPEDEYDSWCINYMKNRRERILARKPFILLDFANLI